MVRKSDEDAFAFAQPRYCNESTNRVRRVRLCTTLAFGSLTDKLSGGLVVVPCSGKRKATCDSAAAVSHPFATRLAVSDASWSRAPTPDGKEID